MMSQSLLKSVGEQVRSGSLIVKLESEADGEGDKVFLTNKFHLGKQKKTFRSYFDGSIEVTP